MRSNEFVMCRATILDNVHARTREIFLRSDSNQRGYKSPTLMFPAVLAPRKEAAN
jgi:hypothetical protein